MTRSAEGKGPQPELVLACFAVKEEAGAFQRIAETLPQVRVLITGMGKVNAERALRQWLAREKPALVLNCGFAGGLNPALNLGDVVFAVEANPELQAKLGQAGARPARFHCVDRVAATNADKRALRQASGADAVEMESHAMEQVCREHAIPWGTVRVILDTAEEDLPLDFSQLLTPEQQMDYRKLAGALMKSPGKVAALLKLQKQSRQAAAALAQVLKRGLS